MHIECAIFVLLREPITKNISYHVNIITPNTGSPISKIVQFKLISQRFVFGIYILS